MTQPNDRTEATATPEIVVVGDRIVMLWPDGGERFSIRPGYPSDFAAWKAYVNSHAALLKVLEAVEEMHPPTLDDESRCRICAAISEARRLLDPKGGA